MIKAFFFDFDGVLTTDPNGGYTMMTYLSKETGIQYDVLLKAWHLVAPDLCGGKKMMRDVLPIFCEAIGKKITLKMMREAYASTPENREMVDFAERLRAAGFIIGIITDNLQERMDYLVKYWDISGIFDPIVTSAQTGMFKSNGKKIFEIALEKVDVLAEDAIFIDNKAANLAGATALGMKTYYHDDSKNDVVALKDFLESLTV